MSSARDGELNGNRMDMKWKLRSCIDKYIYTYRYFQKASHYRPQFFAFRFWRIVLQNRDIGPLNVM